MNIEKLLEDLIDEAEILGFYRFEYEKGHATKAEFERQFERVDAVKQRIINGR